MINYLPIKSIRSFDKDLVDHNTFLFSKLTQAKYPICDGVIVFVPKLKRSFNPAKTDILNVEIPYDLKEYLLKNLAVNVVTKTWSELLKIWEQDLKSNKKLSPKTILFLNKVISLGKVHVASSSLASLKKDSVIKVEQGNLNPSELNKLDKLSLSMDKYLGVSYIYNFVVDEDADLKRHLKITHLSPFIETLNEQKAPFKKVLSSPINQIKLSTIKLFSSNLSNTLDKFSGFIFSGQDNQKFDSKVNALKELSLTGKPVIFKVGSLRDEIAQNISLEDLEIFLFLRNKYQLQNVHIAMPQTRSVSEFLNLKRLLASKGINRKGNLKLWLELGTPENLINIDDYLTAEFDGALLDLDNMSQSLGQNSNSTLYPNLSIALSKFLKESLQKLNKSKIPFIASGKNSLKDEVLSMLIASGLYGLLIEDEVPESIKADLAWHEKNHHKSLLAI